MEINAFDSLRPGKQLPLCVDIQFSLSHARKQNIDSPNELEGPHLHIKTHVAKLRISCKGPRCMNTLGQLT